MQERSPVRNAIDRSGQHLQKGSLRNVHCMLGMPIDIVTMDEVLGAISDAQKTRRPLFISTPNLNFIALGCRDSEFGVSLRRSDLTLVDGIAVLFVCRCLGIPVSERVAGSDILGAFLAADQAGGADPLRVFFFGGSEEAGEKACLELNRLQPDRVLGVGHLCPGYGSVEEMSTDDILSEINAARPDFVIVSLGAQKGQSWIMHNRLALEAPVVSHLGATINFFAGSVRRAPKIWQKMGLEWAWRIREEPQLAARYWNDGRVFLKVFLTQILPLAFLLRWTRWRHGRENFEARIIETDDVESRVPIGGPFLRRSLDKFYRTIDDITGDTKTIVLDLSDVTCIDTAAMGALLDLSNTLSARGCRLQIVNVRASIARLFRLNDLDDVFDLAKRNP